MKIQPYIERLNSSDAFKRFHDKYNDAFLVAGFFILDYETGQNIHQIDYYIPSEKKVAAFTLDNEIMMQILSMMADKVPERLDIETETDLDAIKGILEDEMKNRNITEDIKKIIAVIQQIEGKKIWILNCILSGMEILKAHLDDDSRTILLMEKASVLDYIKRVPMEASSQNKEPSEADVDVQLKQLDKLKKVLQKEKEKLKKKGKTKGEDVEEVEVVEDDED